MPMTDRVANPQQLPGIKNKIRRAICLHKRVVFGPYRDICVDCLAIVAEHSR